MRVPATVRHEYRAAGFVDNFRHEAARAKDPCAVQLRKFDRRSNSVEAWRKIQNAVCIDRRRSVRSRGSAEAIVRGCLNSRGIIGVEIAARAELRILDIYYARVGRRLIGKTLVIGDSNWVPASANPPTPNSGDVACDCPLMPPQVELLWRISGATSNNKPA